jgi:hypothetical protein
VARVSVTRAGTIRRWTLAAGLVVVLASTPAAVSRVRGLLAGARTPSIAAAELVHRMLASADVAHAGLVERQGSTSLPDIPALSSAAATLGGTSRTRVWWASPDRWRVDSLSTTGERDTYGSGGGLVEWDYEDNELTAVRRIPDVRLPRADDLLPPQTARRLLAGLDPADRLETVSTEHEIAGIAAEGVRVIPADHRATVTVLELWADPGSGLPLSVTIRGPGSSIALQTRFLQLQLGTPPAQVLGLPAAPGARREVGTLPDPIDQLRPKTTTPLPPRLGGMDRSASVLDGAATYGAGLARFIVVPLRLRLAAEAVASARTQGTAPLALGGGDAVQLRRGVLGVVLARDRAHAYLLGGLVGPDVLLAAAGQLLAHPSGRG